MQGGRMLELTRLDLSMQRPLECRNEVHFEAAGIFDDVGVHQHLVWFPLYIAKAFG